MSRKRVAVKDSFGEEVIALLSALAIFLTLMVSTSFFGSPTGLLVYDQNDPSGSINSSVIFLILFIMTLLVTLRVLKRRRKE